MPERGCAVATPFKAHLQIKVNHLGAAAVLGIAPASVSLIQQMMLVRENLPNDV